MSKQITYGLVIESEHKHGTRRVTARVVTREPGGEYPRGCDSRGESEYSDAPKHLHGLALDGFQISGHVYSSHDGTAPRMIGFEPEYREVFSIEQQLVERMTRTFKRVARRIDANKAYEPGDKFAAICAALKLSFVAEKIIDRHGCNAWRFMEIAEGRNRFRDLMNRAIADHVAAA